MRIIRWLLTVVAVGAGGCGSTAPVDHGARGSGTALGPLGFSVRWAGSDGTSSASIADKGKIDLFDFDYCHTDGGASSGREIALALHAAQDVRLGIGTYVVVGTGAGFTKTRQEVEVYLSVQGQLEGTGSSGAVVLSELRTDGAAGTFDIDIVPSPPGTASGKLTGTFNATTCP